MDLNYAISSTSLQQYAIARKPLNSQLDICQIKTPHNSVQQSLMSKESLLRIYPGCFKEIGALPGTYKIPTREDAVPCKEALRSVQESQRELLRKELQRMQDIVIIENVNGPTDWGSSIVIVGMPNGDIRICQDRKRLAIIREHHHTRKLEDALPQLNNAKVFSKLDARSGYWNI